MSTERKVRRLSPEIIDLSVDSLHDPKCPTTRSACRWVRLVDRRAKAHPRYCVEVETEYERPDSERVAFTVEEINLFSLSDARRIFESIVSTPLRVEALDQ